MKGRGVSRKRGDTNVMYWKIGSITNSYLLIFIVGFIWEIEMRQVMCEMVCGYIIRISCRIWYDLRRGVVSWEWTRGLILKGVVKPKGALEGDVAWLVTYLANWMIVWEWRECVCVIVWSTSIRRKMAMTSALPSSTTIRSSTPLISWTVGGDITKGVKEEEGFVVSNEWVMQLL